MMSTDRPGRRRLQAQAAIKTYAAVARVMGLASINEEVLSEAAIAVQNLNKLVDSSSSTLQIQTVSYVAQAEARPKPHVYNTLRCPLFF